MLSVTNLHVSVEGKPILKGVSLNVRMGETHAIMGPNGSGKSTLAKVIAGHPKYEVTEGSITFSNVNGHDRTVNVLQLEPHERAAEGIFMAFQYPVEIPGVSNAVFLRAAINQIRKFHGEPELDPIDFDTLLREELHNLNMSDTLIDRAVNVDFSGGEKKRNEILQLSVLKPKLAVLDETDSGLDIDSMKIVAKGVNRLRGPNRAIVLITHYQRLLNYIEPDVVHVLEDGKIVRTGDKSLAMEIENKGYEWLSKR